MKYYGCGHLEGKTIGPESSNSDKIFGPYLMIGQDPSGDGKKKWALYLCDKCEQSREKHGITPDRVCYHSEQPTPEDDPES